MERLDKVIAGLQNCSYPSENCYYSDCPYYGERNGDKVCMDFLMEDALELLKEVEPVLRIREDLNRIKILDDPLALKPIEPVLKSVVEEELDGND